MDAKERLARMIEEYQHLIFSVCVKMTQDYFAAEDLTQDTFLAAFRHMESFDGVNEKAWLCRIASNKCIDYLRQVRKRNVPEAETLLEQQPTGEGLPEKAVLERDAYRELEVRCANLSPPYDRIARLYFLEGRKAAEISELDGKNIKTVQTQIYRARAMLREIYADTGPEKGEAHGTGIFK